LEEVAIDPTIVGKDLIETLKYKCLVVFTSASNDVLGNDI
jgi:hypothetical protein